MRDALRFLYLAALAVALALATGVSWGDQETGTTTDDTAGQATPANQGGLLARLMAATDPQREELGRYIGERCPNLAADILAFITKEAPESLSVLEGAIGELIEARYEGLEEFIGQELQATPELHGLVYGVIAERYPALPTELAALPDGAGRAEAARELIATRYPKLIADILETLKQQRPALLTTIQQRVLAKFPRLVAEVTTVVLRRYPGLTLKLIAFLRQRYPSLIPALISILATPTAAPAPSAPPSDPPPVAPGPPVEGPPPAPAPDP